MSGTYVAAFYLGGTAAGLAYPPFLHLGVAWGLGLAGLVTASAAALAGRAVRD
ncbi:hypothetical protein Mterra_02245 [Calidithermus terrae]|uniref:Uncharacterized protein n=1 Tax=Calidithermus terrae TaxID=1408545 RepID=A0A399EI03_9DEIN|nr:hypothetical protein Mterra_02245 [Calidithermus terrae]